MTRWQRNLLDALYVAMEAIPWFAAITVIATIGERGYLTALARELRFRNNGEFFTDAERATEVTQLLMERADSATSGPALWVVALAGFGAFWLMRAMLQLRLAGSLGAAVLVIASVFGLNILLHHVAHGLGCFRTQNAHGFAGLFQPNQ